MRPEVKKVEGKSIQSGCNMQLSGFQIDNGSSTGARTTENGEIKTDRVSRRSSYSSQAAAAAAAGGRHSKKFVGVSQ
jgi:hypothetical protein